MAIIYKDVLRVFKNLIWLSKNDIEIKVEEQFTDKDIKKMILEGLKDPHVTISSGE